MSRVGPSVLKKLRRLYLERWGRAWPHDNAYLAELWLDARKTQACTAKRGPYLDWVYEETLIEMRTNHNWSPS